MNKIYFAIVIIMTILAIGALQVLAYIVLSNCGIASLHIVLVLEILSAMIGAAGMAGAMVLKSNVQLGELKKVLGPERAPYGARSH